VHYWLYIIGCFVYIGSLGDYIVYLMRSLFTSNESRLGLRRSTLLTFLLTYCLTVLRNIFTRTIIIVRALSNTPRSAALIDAAIPSLNSLVCHALRGGTASHYTARSISVSGARHRKGIVFIVYKTKTLVADDERMSIACSFRFPGIRSVFHRI